MIKVIPIEPEKASAIKLIDQIETEKNEKQTIIKVCLANSVINRATYAIIYKITN